MRSSNGLRHYVCAHEDRVAVFYGSVVDLYWLPLGAGGYSVRLNGRVFEAVAARVQHRRTFDLYHAALEVRLGKKRFVIEQAPVPTRTAISAASSWKGR
jgi:hypothetical protein